MAGTVPDDIVGFRALGRHGVLGEVVEVARDHGDSERVILVRGGVSDGLTFHVPLTEVQSVSRERRVVQLAVDVTDFLPYLQADGTIELRMSRPQDD